ncbi:hypothetical protein [Zooshikella harenae]|uniref:Uncharacterized protein n=1 Tax=Zooshikella harenae TaxID=2827238 RepID=A0ABS5ZAJ4_9GAMM|nr:hypothetical protein [Zooshikella harenae]MBU2710908.1 hypothetical protein [Zooshikella harenae]
MKHQIPNLQKCSKSTTHFLIIACCLFSLKVLAKDLLELDDFELQSLAQEKTPSEQLPLKAFSQKINSKKIAKPNSSNCRIFAKRERNAILIEERKNNAERDTNYIDYITIPFLCLQNEDKGQEDRLITPSELPPSY